jgi:two-component system phosphate regulon sensor histidine kinase PhoR
LSRSQLKLMAALAALVIFVVAVTSLLAERSLRKREQERLTRTMQDHAELVLELTAQTPFEPDRLEELDAIADRAGRITRTRVTLIARDGTVLGDSEVETSRLSSVENHGSRPEVVAANAGSLGTSVRTSSTVGRPLLYVAVPDPEDRGVVRVAIDASVIGAASDELRRALFNAAGIGLAAALALSYVLAWITLRPVREIQGLTTAIAAGDLETRLPMRFSDELGAIARAIRELADQLRERLDEATAEKERLQAVLEGMTEGVLVADPDGRIRLVNDRAREFFDIPERVVGKTIIEAVRHGRLAELLAAVNAQHRAVEGVIEVTQPANRILQVHAVPFPTGSPHETGTVAVFHDVTELTRLERMRREFVANASHELRTPLAAIRGFAETLLNSSDLEAGSVRQYLEVIDRHSKRLGNLVDDLLELSRIESGKTQLEMEVVDVAALAQRIARDNQSRATDKDLDLTTSAHGPIEAWANATAVEQVITNLLDNAIKYTDPGGVLELEVESEPDQVRVRLRDSGIGIPESDLGRIFERFYRVDKARSRELGGTGLGLAIVKHLLQIMGGDIHVTSEVGKGTEFTFTLPNKRLPTIRS